MTRLRTIPLRLAAALAAPVLAACGDPSGSDGEGPVPNSELAFLEERPDAPALEEEVVSFWAVKGDDREVRIDYVNGRECLRFKLDDESLLRRPNGTLIAEGDSVLITIRAIDISKFQFEFQPAGLRFDPDEPAELRINYEYADPDYDDDGDVDDDDQEQIIGLYRRETASQPWFKVGTAEVDEDFDRVRADLDGFTQYAMATGRRSAAR
jgi:hypothetical protein